MYEHFGDHLEAEFDRILFVLETIIERRLATDGVGTLPEEESVGSTTPDIGRELSTIGSRLRSLTGASQRREGTDSPLGNLDRERFEALTAEIETNVEAAKEAGVSLRLDYLASAFDLSRTDLDALLLALAPVFDRSIGTAYGNIQGVDQPRLPTVDLLEEILVFMNDDSSESKVGDTPGASLSSSSLLFQHGLLERLSRDPGYPESYDLVTVDERIVKYLKGDDSLDQRLKRYVSTDRHDRSLADLVFDEETAATLETIHARSRAADAPTIFYVSGEGGTGKDRLPGALTDPETPILRADAADILHDEALTTRLIREAVLQDAAIHLEGLESVTGDEEGPTINEDDGGLEITTDDRLTVDKLVERLDDAPGDVFLSHTDEWKPDVDLADHRVETAHCPFPDYDTRLEIWEEHRNEVAEDYLLENVSTNFRLPQRDIRRAVTTARYLCRTDADAEALEELDVPDLEETDGFSDGEYLFAPIDGALEREHLYEACKCYSASNLEALAEPMELGYTFDDIYLNDKPKTHLRELCGHIQYRGQVTSEWGFGEPGDRGDGVVAMFYGPPGTGKTMAAEIIANETGLDLYRVDLSQIVNKYIGETESRLGALLEEAERSNAILLFDEADSLFGERTDVGDSTDRYANNVTNFLLQRLESFDGIALLTTNKRSGIDPAFKRRIAHSVLFDVPQERIRQRIWQEIWPDEAIVDTDTFDYEFLGLLSLTPAVIRKVAKYAAYIAATEAHDGHPLEESAADLADVTITFDHVVLGLQYAEEAGGVAIEGEFFQYEEKLRSYENQAVGRDIETLFKLKYGVDEDTATVDSGRSTEAGTEPALADNDGTTADTSSNAAMSGDGTVDGVSAVDTEPGESTGEPDTELDEPTREPNTVLDDGPTSDADTELDDADTATQDVDTADAITNSVSDSGVAPSGLEPEAIVERFYDGIDTKNLQAVQALYHSSTAVDELSRQELMAMHLNDAAIVTSPRRTTDEADRIVLEFEEESTTHRIPMVFELRTDDSEWRIYSIEHGDPVAVDDTA